MKRRILGLLGLGLLWGTMQSAQATSYQFSLQLFTGVNIIDTPLVTGYFDGTQSGDNITGTVTGITNLHAFWNGTPFLGNGAVFANSVDSSNNVVTGNAVASFSIFGNNFVFADCDLTTATPVLTAVFSLPIR